MPGRHCSRRRRSRSPNSSARAFRCEPAADMTSAVLHAAAPVRGGWVREQQRAYLLGLSPSLLVLGAITLLPALALLIVSLTPLSLLDPGKTFHFNDPLVNYRQLLEDQRFLRS